MLLTLALCLLGLPGCPEPPPPVPTDTGPRMDAPRDVPGGSDGGTDAGDTAGLDAPELDGGGDVPIDGGGFDVPPRADTPFDSPEPDGAVMLPDAACGASDCACIPRGPSCSASACGMDEVCLDDGCGMTCAPPGAPCTGPVDCPAGSMCKSVGLGLYCVRAGGCADSRDCPRGFACEAGSCVDRRVGCDGRTPCPVNFFCDESVGRAFCVRIVRPCGVGGCPLTAACIDVDADGDNECLAAGSCDASSACGAGMTCFVEPLSISAECGRYGVCRTDPECGPGRRCVDLWGDLVGECVDAGGECLSQEDCGPGELCGTPAGGGATVCLARPFPL